MTVRERENYIYAGIALGCLIFLLWAIPANSPPYPGYGLPTTLVPNVAVGFILLLAVAELIKNYIAYKVKKTPSEPIPEKDKARLWHFTKIMVPCILLLPAMKWMGFLPAGALFILLMQYYCGQRNPVKLVVVTACVVGAMYGIMTWGGLPMP